MTREDVQRLADELEKEVRALGKRLAQAREAGESKEAVQRIEQAFETKHRNWWKAVHDGWGA